MRITKKQLNRLIKEEIAHMLKEDAMVHPPSTFEQATSYIARVDTGMRDIGTWVHYLYGLADYWQSTGAVANSRVAWQLAEQLQTIRTNWTNRPEDPPGPGGVRSMRVYSPG